MLAGDAVKPLTGDELAALADWAGGSAAGLPHEIARASPTAIEQTTRSIGPTSGSCDRALQEALPLTPILLFGHNARLDGTSLLRRRRSETARRGRFGGEGASARMAACPQCGSRWRFATGAPTAGRSWAALAIPLGVVRAATGVKASGREPVRASAPSLVSPSPTSATTRAQTSNRPGAVVGLVLAAPIVCTTAVGREPISAADPDRG